MVGACQSPADPERVPNRRAAGRRPAMRRSCPRPAGRFDAPRHQKKPRKRVEVTTLAGPDGGWSRGWGVEPEKRSASAAVHPMVASSGRYRQPPRGTFRNREADELVWIGAGPPAGRRAPGGDRSDRAHQVDQTLESDHPDRAAPGSPRKPALQFRCGAGAPFYAAAWSSRSRAWWTWWAPWRVHWPPVRVRCPVAFSLSTTLAHERPAARCSMMAARVSCSPWCHARRPAMNWNP